MSGALVGMSRWNARVGNEVIEGIVGRHGVPGRNESRERLLDMCAEKELLVGNSWFTKNYVYKYTWCIFEYNTVYYNTIIILLSFLLSNTK